MSAEKTIKPVAFNDLKILYRALKPEILNSIQRVLESGWYILGPELENFENSFAEYLGRKYVIGVANGTDAIELSLRAADIRFGDEVITVSHTAVPTVSAIERTGAVPVLVDIDLNSYTMSPVAVEAALTPKTKAIIPVHIYGHMADIEALSKIAIKNNLLLIEDCAQAQGASYKGKKAGTFGHFGTYSFYPTKNLGAYGDGGAVATNDRQLAERIYRIRNYGQTQKYVHVERGVNSRLDEIQAALLSLKLKYLDQHNAIRRHIASLYNHHLTNVIIPETQPNYQHIYHLYVIRYSKRDKLRGELSKIGIGTAIHYPIPIHLQKSHASLGMRVGSLPITEKIVQEIISLPMFIGLEEDEIQYVYEQTRNLTEVLK